MTPLTLISQFYWMARKTYFSALSCTLPPFPLFVCLVYHCPSPFIPLFLSWLLDFFSPSPIAANPSLNPSPPTPHCLFPSFTIFPWSFHFDPFTSVFVFAPTHDFLSSYNFTLSSHTPATSLWFFFFFYPPCIKPVFMFFLPTPQGCEASGSSHVKSQAGSLHLCQGFAVPELLRADSRLQPAHCQTSAAAHPTARVLQPRAACTYSMHTSVS